MTSYEQYREQMARHTRETAHFSFTRTDHPAFQAMLAMGSDITGHLLHDMLTYRDGDSVAIARTFSLSARGLRCIFWLILLVTTVQWFVRKIEAG